MQQMHNNNNNNNNNNSNSNNDNNNNYHTPGQHHGQQRHQQQQQQQVAPPAPTIPPPSDAVVVEVTQIVSKLFSNAAAAECTKETLGKIFGILSGSDVEKIGKVCRAVSRVVVTHMASQSSRSSAYPVDSLLQILQNPAGLDKVSAALEMLIYGF